MRKELRLIKRLVALFLVLLLSIESFGAVVSDNDGSAFITKAEFDSLKNDFQSQIDQYNTSIDSKIDGAIASYLAGINVAYTEKLPVLIEGYTNMRWVPDWKVYGYYKTWTGWDESQESRTGWYQPHFNDARVVLWNDQIRLTDLTSVQYAGVEVTVLGTIEEYYGCTRGPGGNPGNTGQAQAPPVGAIKLLKKNDNWILASGTMLVAWWASPLWCFSYQTDAYNNITGEAPYNLARYECVIKDGSSWLTLQPVANAIWAYDAIVGTATNENQWTLHNVVESKNARFPLAIGMNDYSGEHGYSATTAMGVQDSGSVDVQSLLSAGVHWDRFTQFATQNTNFYYMMLGHDNNQMVNLFKDPQMNNANFKELDIEGSPGNATVVANVTSVTLNPLNFYADRGPSPDVADLDLTLNIPLLPQSSLGELSNGLWEYQNKSLKMGQGLPLLNYASDDGYLQISFDYDVKNMLNGTSQNKKIQIDIKKDDYLTSSAGYKNGFEGLDDPYKTSKSLKTLHNYNYDSNNGHLDLTCEVKKGDIIWLRLSPQDDSNGLYASISNLNCSLLSNKR